MITIKIKSKFLAVKKEYFGKGLKAIDLLILSQVEEFDRNNCTCYMTDEQLMFITGAKSSAVRASLKRLEDKNILVRDTKLVTGNGCANKRRTLYLNKNYRDSILKNKICNVENQQLINNLNKNEIIILEEQSSSNAMIQSFRYY